MMTGIKGMLQQMTPSQQYVALGAIGRSSPDHHEPDRQLLRLQRRA